MDNMIMIKRAGSEASKAVSTKEGRMVYFLRMFVVIAAAGIFLIATTSSSFAQKKTKKNKFGKKVSGIEKIDTNVYTGPIVSISRRYITIEISRDPVKKSVKEIVIPYDDQTVLTGVSSGKEIKDLLPGDVVKIDYSENYLEDTDQKRHAFKRIATQISLIAGVR